MSNKRIRIGVLGCAAIADRSTIPAIRRSQAFELAAVASRSPERARDFAERHSTSASSYDALLERPDVDAVYVPLPVGLHYEWGRRLLDAGKHLLLEKTFTERGDQAAELIALAGDRGLVAMEGLMYRFHPVHVRLRGLLREGTIGALRHVDAQFGMPMLPAGDIRRDVSIGGGASLDSLVYPLSLSLELLEIPSIEVEARIIRDESGLDLRGVAQLAASGATAHIAFGMGFFYRNVCHLWGETGSVTLDRAFTRPPDMAAELSVRTAEGQRSIHVEPADHFIAMLEHFAARIWGEADPSPAEGQDLMQRMRFIDRIRAAAPGS